MKPSLTYVCLQTTQPGQAAHAHVYEIIRGLKRRGWSVRLVQPTVRLDASASTGERRLTAVIGKVLAFFSCQLPVLFQPLPNAFYIRHHFASLVTVVWARLRRRPVYVEVNGPYEDLFIAWPSARKARAPLTWMLRTQLRLATSVIAVTPQLADWAKREGGHCRVEVIPNGANTELFRPQSEHAPAPADKAPTLDTPYVLFFGALAPWQGIHSMLFASQLPTWPSDTRLVVVGEGEMFDAVRDMARMDARVKALGKVAYEELPTLISSALVTLSVQTNLGGRSSTGLFPLKLFESLACGTPVIVSDFPGMADFVRTHGCGVVISPDCPEEIAEVVKRLRENPDVARQMGTRGMIEVQRNHSWDARAAATAEVIAYGLKAAGGRT